MHLALYLRIQHRLEGCRCSNLLQCWFVFQISKTLVMQQKAKYRNGVMNVREQRRQGSLEKNYDKAKSLGSSQTSSSVAHFESSSRFLSI